MARENVIVAALLIFAIVLGAYFRFNGNNWDDYVRWHPDERYLAGQIGPAIGGPLVAPDPRWGCADGSGPCTPDQRTVYDRYNACVEKYPATGGRGSYFDTDCSPYNPENIALTNYAYGTLPLFMARISAEFYSDFSDDNVFLQYRGFALVWRAVSAMVDTLVIALVFFMGARLHNKWVGVVAALIYAGAVLPIQLAHFGTADAVTNFFVALALYFAIRTQDTGSLWDFGSFGIALGMAVASRINVAPLAAVIAIVAFFRVLPAFDAGTAWRERNRILLTNFLGVMLAAFLSLLAFRIFNPYAFEGPSFFNIMLDDRFQDTLAVSQRNVSGEAESPPNWQWVNRTPYLFAWNNMVVWGMGLAFGLAGWAAWAASGWRLLRGRVNGVRNVALFAWIAGYFAFAGGLWVMSMRYYLPLYPAFAVLAAWGLVGMYNAAQRFGMRWRRVGAGVVLVSVTALTLLWGLMFTNVYRNQATFVQASYWVAEQLPGDFYTQLDGADPDAPLITINQFNSGAPASLPVGQRLLEGASILSDQQPSTLSFVAPDDGTISSITAHRLVGVTTQFNEATERMDVVPDAAERIVQLSLSEVFSAEDGDVDTALASVSSTITGSFPGDMHILGKSYEFAFDVPFPVERGREYALTVTVAGGPMRVSGAVLADEQPWDEPFPARVCELPFGTTLADNPDAGLFGPRECADFASYTDQIHHVQMEVVLEDTDFKRDYWQQVLDNVDYIAIQTNRRYDSQSRIPARWPLTNRYYDALFSGELGFELAAQFQETFEFGPLKVSDQHLPTYDSPDWLNEFEAEEAFHVYDHPVVFIFRKTDAYSSENTATILNSVPLTRAGTVFGGYNSPEIAEVMVLDSLSADEAPTHLMLTDEMERIQETGGTWSQMFDVNSPINDNQLVTIVVWWGFMVLLGWATWSLLFAAFPALADRGYGMAKIIGLLLMAWFAWVLGTVRLQAWTQIGLIVLFGLLVLAGLYVTWRTRKQIFAYVNVRWRLLVAIEVLTGLLFVLMIGIRLTNPDLWHNNYGGEKPMDFAYFNAVLRSSVFPAFDPWFADGYINYYYFGFVIVGVPTKILGIVPALAYNLILPTLFSMTGIAAFSLAFNVTSGWRERHEDSEGATTKRQPMGNPWMAGIIAMSMAVILGNLATPLMFARHAATIGGHTQPNGMDAYFYDQLLDDYIDTNLALPDEGLRAQIRQEANQRALDAGFVDHLIYTVDHTISFINGLVSGVDDVVTGNVPGVNPSRWFWGPTRLISELRVATPGGLNPPGDGAINEMPFFTFLYGDLHAHMIAMPMMIFAMAFVYNELMTAGRDRRKFWQQALALFLGALTVGLFQATNTWDWPTFLILSIAGLSFAWVLRWQPTHNFSPGGTLRWLADGLLRWWGDLGSQDRSAQNNAIGKALLLTAFIVLPVGMATLVGGTSAGMLVFIAIVGGAVGLIAMLALFNRMTRRPLLDFVFRVGGFVAIAFLVAWPFNYWFASGLTEFGMWDGMRTPLNIYLLIHGLFIFVIVSLLTWETARWLRATRVSVLRGNIVWVFGFMMYLFVVGFAAFIMAFTGYQVGVLVIPLVAWIALLFFRPDQSRPMQFILALIGLGLCITLGTEFVRLLNDNGRQNTIFKFYLQVWLMFSIVGGVGIAWVTRDSFNWRTRLAVPWYGVAALLFFVAALYPIMATQGKSQFRMPGAENTPLTLDGLDYLQYAQHWEGGLQPGNFLDMADEYNAIRWLQDNVEGSPTIMEGLSTTVLYRWGGRISVNTGLPAVVGWDFHQRQQRSLRLMGDRIGMRVANVNAFYSTTDVNIAAELLRYYEVEYVVFTHFERQIYTIYDEVTGDLIDDSALQKFPQMVEMGLLEVVHTDANDVPMIYEVNQAALYDLLRQRVTAEGDAVADNSLTDGLAE